MIRFIDALEVYYMRVWDLSVFLNNKIHHQKTMASFHQAHNQLKLSRKKNEEPKTPNNKSIFLEAGKLNAITLMFFFILFFSCHFAAEFIVTALQKINFIWIFDNMKKLRISHFERKKKKSNKWKNKKKPSS
jgi:hypothetical protein